MNPVQYTQYCLLIVNQTQNQEFISSFHLHWITKDPPPCYNLMVLRCKWKVHLILPVNCKFHHFDERCNKPCQFPFSNFSILGAHNVSAILRHLILYSHSPTTMFLNERSAVTSIHLLFNLRTSFVDSNRQSQRSLHSLDIFTVLNSILNITNLNPKYLN
jgi:hypothetical protein